MASISYPRCIAALRTIALSNPSHPQTAAAAVNSYFLQQKNPSSWCGRFGLGAAAVVYLPCSQISSSAALQAQPSTSSAGKRYAINYHRLKDSGVLGGKTKEILQEDSTPSTVSDNVKNVQGWRGAARRGFMGTYPDCIHQITAKSAPYGVNDWITKVLTHYLGSAFLQDRHGLLVPVAYYQIREKVLGNGSASSATEAEKKRNLIRQEMKGAHALGWAVELARASSLLASDIIIGGSGSHQDNSQVIHHAQFLSRDTNNGAVNVVSDNLKKLNCGAVAFNDAMILRNSVYALVSANFEGTPAYPHILSDFLDSFETLSIGQAALLKLSTAKPGKERLSQVDMGMYKRIIRSTVTDAKFILPVRLALHLGGLTDQKAHAQAHSILNDIGYLVEVTGDFANCYYDSAGADIEEGRLTWLIVNAYQRASPAHKVALEENYGYLDSSKAAVVKQVYEDLKLKKLCARVIEDTRNEMLTSIQQLSTMAGLPPSFFFALLDNMENLS